MIACKHCEKPCETFGRSGILRHIKVSKVCFQAYSSQEVEEMELASVKAKKEYAKEYHEKNKPERKEYHQKKYQENKTSIKAERRAQYKEIKESKKVKMRTHYR